MPLKFEISTPLTEAVLTEIETSQVGHRLRDHQNTSEFWLYPPCLYQPTHMLRFERYSLAIHAVKVHKDAIARRIAHIVGEQPVAEIIYSEPDFFEKLRNAIALVEGTR